VKPIHRISTSRGAKELSRFVPPSLRDYFINTFAPYISHQNTRAALKGRLANSDSILRRLKESYIPVKCPLVLISQVQRSGGSLLSQLFDGHSEILAHPQELKIGYPSKEQWPPIKEEFSAEKQFDILFEPSIIRMCEEGYAKGRTDPDRRNFFFIPAIQRELFRHISEQAGNRTPRDVLDSYFTSYFNSWLNLRSNIARARYTTGFVPLLVNDKSNMDSFWNTYPDGYLISVIRSPLSWYPSAARLLNGKKYDNIELGARRWRESTQAIMNEKARQGDRVIVLHFDDLVTRTEDVMRLICERLGLAFEPMLLQPTFNGETMVANTSFDRVERGVVSSAPTKRHELLSEADRSYLEQHCMPLYKQALHDMVEVMPNTKAAAE
jgi:hypothetical protein